MTASEAKALMNKATVNNLEKELQELYALIRWRAERGHNNAFVAWMSPLDKEQLFAKGYGIVHISNNIKISWAI